MASSTMPVERPVHYDSAMVRAILDGRKTQMRRPIKGISILDHPGIKGAKIANIGKNQFWLNCQDSHPQHISKGCPFGQIGDRLWVREPWHPFFRMGNHVSIEYKAGFSFATDISGADLDKFNDKWIEGKWKTSIHMPRWASRITLEITEIRVQRVQEISDEEAILEGLKDLSPSPREAFRLWWNSVYAQKTFDFDRDWEVNPWVWTIGFRNLI